MFSGAGISFCMLLWMPTFILLMYMTKCADSHIGRKRGVTVKNGEKKKQILLFTFNTYLFTPNTDFRYNLNNS